MTVFSPFFFVCCSEFVLWWVDMGMIKDQHEPALHSSIIVKTCQ